tara:strand:- start:275 stop:724 length:450 start_codon:yes stop_codon:yes gene_type:complete
MASVKGANITNMDATPVVKVDSENAGGKIRVFHDTFEASSLASGSDITIARIPANATIHDVVVKCDALGSGVTLKVGDSGDDDRYITVVGTWNVAGQSQSMLAGSSTGSPVPAVTGLGYRTTASTDVLITTGGASATGTIFCWVMYSTE